MKLKLQIPQNLFTPHLIVGRSTLSVAQSKAFHKFEKHTHWIPAHTYSTQSTHLHSHLWNVSSKSYTRRKEEVPTTITERKFIPNSMHHKGGDRSARLKIIIVVVVLPGWFSRNLRWYLYPLGGQLDRWQTWGSHRSREMRKEKRSSSSLVEASASSRCFVGLFFLLSSPWDEQNPKDNLPGCVAFMCGLNWVWIPTVRRRRHLPSMQRSFIHFDPFFLAPDSWSPSFLILEPPRSPWKIKINILKGLVSG